LCLYGHDTVEATKKMMHPNIFDFCYPCVARRKNFWCAHKAGSDGQGYKCSRCEYLFFCSAIGAVRTKIMSFLCPQNSVVFCEASAGISCHRLCKKFSSLTNEMQFWDDSMVVL
jgi:hypothetical protein